jgi:ABC-type molybdenum transport system ATPase subunit/photorepair protein PhrA
MPSAAQLRALQSLLDQQQVLDAMLEMSSTRTGCGHRIPHPATEALAAAAMAAEALGVGGLRRRAFARLSQGEQKLLLLARAVVGGPRLLILDEACQALDYGRRQAALALLAAIPLERSSCALVHVSHHPDELAAAGTTAAAAHTPPPPTAAGATWTHHGVDMYLDSSRPRLCGRRRAAAPGAEP